MTSNDDSLSYKYFVAGIPAFGLFEYQLKTLEAILTGQKDDSTEGVLEEIVFVGVISYFESFCKNSFASLINIAPQLIQRLKSASFDIKVDPMHVIELGESAAMNIGFLIAEQIDFGTANKINGIFTALVKRSPLKANQIGYFDKILSDRNLLVHHGGIYTKKYFHQRTPIGERNRVFFDSIVVDKEYVIERIEFLRGISEKIVKGTHDALEEMVKKDELVLNESAKQALAMYHWRNWFISMG